MIVFFIIVCKYVKKLTEEIKYQIKYGIGYIYFSMFFNVFFVMWIVFVLNSSLRTKKSQIINLSTSKMKYFSDYQTLLSFENISTNQNSCLIINTKKYFVKKNKEWTNFKWMKSKKSKPTYNINCWKKLKTYLIRAIHKLHKVSISRWLNNTFQI